MTKKTLLTTQQANALEHLLESYSKEELHEVVTEDWRLRHNENKDSGFQGLDRDIYTISPTDFAIALFVGYEVKDLQQFEIPVKWQMEATLIVSAYSFEKAIEEVIDGSDLPYGEYVNDSFQVDMEQPAINDENAPEKIAFHE